MTNAEQMAKKEEEYHDKRRAEFKDNPDKLKVDVEKILKSKFTPLKESGYIRGERNKKALDLIKIEEIKGKKVLDYACGTGDMGTFFALLGAEVYGFDISGVSVEVANLRA